MSEIGWIKLHRSFINWEWFGDANMVATFVHCLFEANWEDKKWHGAIIERGSFITSYPHLSKNIGISTQQLRTCLERLKSTGEITVKTTNKYSHISINNYNKYQQSTRHVTVQQQSSNSPATTTKEYKEYKNINTTNVALTDYLSLFNSLFESKYQETAGRAKKLASRLKVYPLSQILVATKNLAASPFHRGQNDRGWKADPDFLISSDEKIDKWLNVIPEAEHVPKNRGEAYIPLAMRGIS